tara:strand:+ start:1 stop:978 length:978 start_codon:yes stop_codon:yes gene_type:complete
MLFPNGGIPAGIEISTPNNTNGGSVLMVLNSNNLDGSNVRKEAFNIISTLQSDEDDASLVATFQASGRVGIGTNFPTHEGLTVQKELTIKTRQVVTTLSTSEITTTLVADNTGLVKEVVAAPVPLGGIIMWSGDIGDIPSGWRLCTDGVSAINGVTVPNLSNKFIVASSNTSGTPTSSITGSPLATGGSNTHNHGGFSGETTLVISQIPTHDHIPTAMQGRFRHLTAWIHPAHDGDSNNTDTSTLYGNLVDGVGNTGTGFDEGVGSVGAEIIQQVGFPGAPNGIGQISDMAIRAEGNNAPHLHGISSANNIPVFYALAYIIYVGQ